MGYYTNKGYLLYISQYIPPTLGIGPSNILNQKYVYLDMKNYILSFDKKYNPKYRLKKGKTVPIGNYSGHVTNIMIFTMKLNRTPVDVIFDSGTDLILLPGHIYDSVMVELRNHSNIPFDSRFWRNGYLQLNNIDEITLPDIEFIFDTIEGPMR